MEINLYTTLVYLLSFYITYKILDFIVHLFRIEKYTDRYVFITGCDTGFGNMIAMRLDSLGINVFASCYSENGAIELKSQSSHRIKTVLMDVTNQASVRAAYKYVKDNVPYNKGLWALLNNAGIGGGVGPVDWLTLDQYKRIDAVNLYGLIDVTMTFLPLLKQAQGRIINTASIMGRYSFAGIGPYCVSKYGVESFSDCLRRDMQRFGLSTHIIEPGFYKTPITSTEYIIDCYKTAWKNMPQHIRDDYGEYFFKRGEGFLRLFTTKIPSRRTYEVIDAYEHAVLARFPRARYIVGHDAKFIWYPIQMLPEWLGDKLAHMVCNLPPPARMVKQKQMLKKSSI